MDILENSGALEAQNGAKKWRAVDAHSQGRRGGLKWSCGGSVDQWSQIRIILIVSITQKPYPDPNQSDKRYPHLAMQVCRPAFK